MREYKRTTRECSFNEFPPEVIRAVRKYAGDRELGNLEADALMCAETSSEKLKQSLFSKIFGAANYAVKTCVVVSRARITWATLDNKNQTAVFSARLSEVEIRDFQSNLIEDRGLDVFGVIGELPERASAFIGLGDDAAAEKLRRVLGEAIAAAKRK